MSVFTAFEDIVPLEPDDRRRQAEWRTLRTAGAGAGEREIGDRGPWEIIHGKGIVFSAPHQMEQIRDGQPKRAETGTGEMAFGLARHVGGAALRTVERQSGDPNWDIGSPYVRRALELSGGSPIIDVHMMRPRGVEMCVGLGPVAALADGLWQPLLDEAVRAGLRVSVNWPFGANPRTITGQSQQTGIPAVQVELTWECFDPKHAAAARAWSAMARAAERIKDEQG
jgi:hypothetical protein